MNPEGHVPWEIRQEQLKMGLQNNEARRRELTEAISRLQERSATLEDNERARYHEEMERLNGEILKLNEADKELKAQLRQ